MIRLPKVRIVDNRTTASRVLISSEQTIGAIIDLKIIENLYEQMYVFVDKLGYNSNAGRYVRIALDNKVVYPGWPDGSSQVPIVARVAAAGPKVIQAIVLNANLLNIDKEGNTDQVDNCVYATYFSQIRAGIVEGINEVIRDRKLHDMLITYFMYLTLKILGKLVELTDEQKKKFRMLIAYLFYRHFFSDNHNAAAAHVKQLYPDDYDKKFVESLKPFTTMQALPKALITLDVIKRMDPLKLTMDFFARAGQQAYIYLFGTLDYSVASIVITLYPFEYVPKKLLVSTTIQEKIEEHVLRQYVDDLKYKPLVTNA